MEVWSWLAGDFESPPIAPEREPSPGSTILLAATGRKRLGCTTGAPPRPYSHLDLRQCSPPRARHPQQRKPLARASCTQYPRAAARARRIAAPSARAHPHLLQFGDRSPHPTRMAVDVDGTNALLARGARLAMVCPVNGTQHCRKRNVALHEYRCGALSSVPLRAVSNAASFSHPYRPRYASVHYH